MALIYAGVIQDCRVYEMMTYKFTWNVDGCVIFTRLAAATGILADYLLRGDVAAYMYCT